MIDERWRDEEGWWTRGTAEARRRTHPGAVMVFGQGILQGEAIFAALDGAAGWASVEMAERTSIESDDCLVLAYRARARRDDGSTHDALCSSTWVRQEDGWRIIQHQQTAPVRE